MVQNVGHYTLVRKIGEGAMGVVWEAHDPRLGRAVAIKLIQKETSDPNARSRLWREARAAAGVSHPNVCHVYDVGEHEGELVAIDPWLEPLRSRADVAAVLEESRRRHARALADFEAAEGPRLLAMA